MKTLIQGRWTIWPWGINRRTTERSRLPSQPYIQGTNRHRSKKSALYCQQFSVDTGMGPNIIIEGYWRMHWNRRIKRLDAPKLWTGTNLSIMVRGIILLVVKRGAMQVRQWLFVLKNWQAPIYLTSQSSTSASRLCILHGQKDRLNRFCCVAILDRATDQFQLSWIMSNKVSSLKVQGYATVWVAKILGNSPKT